MTSKDSRPGGDAPSASSGQAPRGRAKPPREFASKPVPIPMSYFLTLSTLSATIVFRMRFLAATVCPLFAFGGLIMRNNSLPGWLAGSLGLAASGVPAGGAWFHRARERRARGGARSGGPDRGGAAAGVRV